MPIGNDVVDLREPGAQGKAADPRFVARVFAPQEADRIRESPDPDRVLWTLWTGKEAAFKAVRKLHPDLPFAHRAFVVTSELAAGGERRAGDPPARLVGTAALPAGPSSLTSLLLSWEIGDSWIHCVALGNEVAGETVHAGVVKLGPVDRPGAVESPLTPREARSVRSHESWVVRQLAKQLAREAGAPLSEIVRERGRRGLGPPRLYARGAGEPLEGWDLSLSHDGEFGAAAVLRL